MFFVMEHHKHWWFKTGLREETCGAKKKKKCQRLFLVTTAPRALLQAQLLQGTIPVAQVSFNGVSLPLPERWKNKKTISQFDASCKVALCEYYVCCNIKWVPDLRHYLLVFIVSQWINVRIFIALRLMDYLNRMQLCRYRRHQTTCRDIYSETELLISILIQVKFASQ